MEYIKHLGELVRNLLANSGSVMWTDSSLDLGRVIDQVLRLSDNEGFIRHIHFEKFIPENLPVVKGSPAYIFQALLNLLLNALRFSPDNSKIRVTVKIEAPWINIYVSDSGPGVNPSVKETLFEQGTTTAGPGDPNAGLGLYFVKRVMDAHNGFVCVHDSSEQGTTFVMGLPIWNESVSG
jgi:signal transduction histidine kinase